MWVSDGSRERKRGVYIGVIYFLLFVFCRRSFNTLDILLDFASGGAASPLELPVLSGRPRGQGQGVCKRRIPSSQGQSLYWHHLLLSTLFQYVTLLTILAKLVAQVRFSVSILPAALIFALPSFIYLPSNSNLQFAGTRRSNLLIFL